MVMRSSLVLRTYTYRICAALICAALVAPAFASDVVRIAANDFLRINLVDHLELLEDPARALAVADVAGTAFDKAFEPATNSNTNIGFTPSAYWLRFTLDMSESVDAGVVLVLDAPTIDRFELYSPNATGGFDAIVMGDGQPFNSRPIKHRNFAVEIDSLRPGPQTFYARVYSDVSHITLPVSLYSQRDFTTSILRANYTFGIYYGAILLLAALTLLSSLLFKSTVFVWYGTYLLTFLLVQMAANGFGYQFLWPSSIWLQANLPTVLVGTSLICGIVFARKFLRFSTQSVSLDRILMITTVIISGAVAYHFVGPNYHGTRIVVAAGVISPVLIFILAARALQLGYAPARYFLIGWGLFLLGVIVTGLHVLGLPPNVPLASYAMQLGSVFQIVFVSLALVHQITSDRQKQDEKIRSAHDELHDLNGSLEQQVYDRTIELETRNQELTELAVRDGLTGLYNHSTAIELLKQVVEHGKRYEFPTAVMMLDIDKFKSVNDTFGHPVGDKVILAVSNMLSDEVRSADVVGRYGGDEFLIVLSHADVSSAREYGERLLERIRRIEVAEIGSHKITGSLGISILNADAEEPTAGKLIQRADQAMYKSKQEGRDRLTISNLSLLSATNR
jgi:diguanylate cyclase (GGDEF)-like protein